MFALVLVLGFSLIIAAPAGANGGTTYYVNAATTADGTVSSYTESTGTLIATTDAFASYDAGDVVEFMTGTAEGWYAPIFSKTSASEVILDRSYGSNFDNGTFNLVDLDTPSIGDPFFYIQAAIDYASSGDTIQVAAGTYYENITLKNEVSVYGAGAGSSIIDGGGSGPVVTANGVGATTTFDGFTIQNGLTQSGGGMLNTGSSLTISNCTFSNNTATGDTGGYGGGMRNNSSPVTLTNCTFSNNTASCTEAFNGCGGGLYNNESSPTLTNCTFSGNQATAPGDGDGQGGGMYNYISSPTLNGCTFTSNSADNYGGGMYNRSSSSPELTGCDFNINTAEYGGGMLNDSAVAMTLTGCDFVGNIATYSGGGMYNANDPALSLTLTGCTFSTNQATVDGGGMYNYSSVPDLSSCTFYDNSANDGGGLYNSNGSSPTLTGCTFSSNQATGSGGGMYNIDSSNTDSYNCTFYDTSALYGGGVCNNDSTPTLLNCTLYGNTATWEGGGIANYSADPTVTNCIISGNTANDGGGIYANDSSSPVIDYNDVLSNTGGNYYGCSAGAHDIATDPLFVNAGAGNFHLTAGSPCIDVGDNSAPSLPATDFEGDTRILDGIGDAVVTVDMGVDEYVLPTPTEVWVDINWLGTAVGTEIEAGKFFGYNAFAGIQAGINAVASPGTVHVAAGTYIENITLKDGVEVLGAGAGVTTIDGGASGSVVTASGVGATTVLDGFTITNGSASMGGGMYNATASPTVSNCIFYDNAASGDTGCGGGMANADSSPTVINCIFYGNTASGLHGCGGGMYNSGSSGAFTPTLVNCTFYGNSANEWGDGVYSINFTTPTLTNCILWNGGDEIYKPLGTPAVATYCDVQGGYGGAGNFDHPPPCLPTPVRVTTACKQAHPASMLGTMRL